MQNGGFIPWDAMPIAQLHRCTAGCLCCMGVRKMPTEEELEQRITSMIDSDGFQQAVREAIESGNITINGKGGGKG